MSFSSSTVSGMKCWFKASSLSLNDGDAVTAWTDSSGNGLDLAQGTGANQPVYKANLRHGKPAVRFDGSNDHLFRASVGWQATTTVFAVVKKTWQTAEYGGIMGAAAYAATAGFGLLTTGGAANGWANKDLLVVGSGYDNTSNPRAFGTYGSIPNDSIQIIEAGANATASYVKIGGETISTTTSAAACDTTSGNLVVGSTATSGSDFMEGDIFEIIVYDKILSAPEVALVEAHLRSEYGLSILNFSGFEAGDLSEASSSANSGTGGTAPSVVTSPVRSGSGTYALKTDTTAASNASYVIMAGRGNDGLVADYNAPTVYHRFYYSYSTKPSANYEPLATLVGDDASNKGRICLNSSGNIVLLNNVNTLVATSSTALTVSTWYRIEYKGTSSSSNSAYELRIYNEANTLLETLSGSMAQGAARHAQIIFGKATPLNTQAIVNYFDDWAVSAVTWLGPGVCKRLAPVANGGTQQWTAGTGSTYAEVDEIPASSSDYVKSTGSANDKALFTFSDPAAAGVSSGINGVILFAATAEDSSVTSANRLRLESSSANRETVSYNGSTSYASRFLLSITDPNTGDPWTLAALKIAAGGSKELNAVAMRMSAVSLFVDFTDVADTGTDFLAISNASLRVDTKIVKDRGEGTSSASVAVTITFNKTFADIISIDVFPVQNSGQKIIRVIDFVDAADPTSFNVRLYNEAGTQLALPFGWTAEGVLKYS